MAKLLAISDLGAAAYCEASFYWNWKARKGELGPGQGLAAEVTEEQERGTQKHHKLEEESRKRAEKGSSAIQREVEEAQRRVQEIEEESELPLEERERVIKAVRSSSKERIQKCLEPARLDVLPDLFQTLAVQHDLKPKELVSREVPVQTGRLIGLIDEVRVYPDRVEIFEDKPKARPYLNYQVQVYGYCMAYQEAYVENKGITACIRELGKRKPFFTKGFGPEEKFLVEEYIATCHCIIDGEPPVGNGRGLCKKCFRYPLCKEEGIEGVR